MIDAWLSSSEHTSTPGPPNVGEHAEVRGEAGGEERGGARSPSTPRARASSSACTGRDPTMRRAAPGAGAPAVERVVRGRDHRRVLGEAEVVVRRERHDGAAVAVERAVGPAASRSRARATARRRGSPRASPSAHVVPASCAAHGVARPRRSRRRARATMRCDLLRRDRERRHRARPRRRSGAAARRARPRPRDTRRPQRRPSAGGASSTPPMSPRRRTSRTAGCGATRSCEQAAQLVGALAHVGEHVPRVEQLEVAQRDRGARARSRCRSARGTACARRGRGRGTRRTPRPLATVADIGR